MRILSKKTNGLVLKFLETEYNRWWAMLMPSKTFQSPKLLLSYNKLLLSYKIFYPFNFPFVMSHCDFHFRPFSNKKSIYKKWDNNHSIEFEEIKSEIVNTTKNSHFDNQRN